MADSNVIFKGKKLKNMFCIDSPVVVENLKSFYKCCGGIQRIEQTFKNQNERLQFRFRPDDPISIPLLSERKTSSDLVIKVRRKQIQQSNKPDDQDFFSDYEFEPYGVSDTIFHFDNTICDMQLLPSSSNICNEIMKSDFILNCDHEYSIENDETNTLLKQSFYSRFTQPRKIFPLLQKEEKTDFEKNLIRRIRKSRKVNALFARWDGDRVPDKMSEEYNANIVSKMNFDKELVDKVKEKFEERSIWSRYALLCQLKCHSLALRYILPLCGYFFENGPFRFLWVSYGYDPRKDPKSKIYQNIEVRIHSHLNDSSGQFKKSFRHSRSNDSSLINQQPSTSSFQEKNQEEFDDKSYLFRPGHSSTLKRNNFQLCDIEIEDVQKIIHENDGKEIEFTEKDGWLSNGAVERIRSIMNQELMKMFEDPQIKNNFSIERFGENSIANIEYEDIEVSEVFESFEFFDHDYQSKNNNNDDDDIIETSMNDD